jgi:hypothetical protein
MRTGSPPNVDVKGNHQAEYAWFAISDSLPGLSISAERAARQIINACRYGDPELTITLPARIAILVSAMAPTAVAQAMMIANRLLPSPNDAAGDRRLRGADASSKWAPSVATVLTDRAAAMNNEV